MAKTNVLQRIKKLKQAVLDSVKHGAEMYANGKGGRPIVDQHFTAGNQQRYGWESLSYAYFMRKQGQIKSKTSANFRGSKLDKNAGYQSTTGEMKGFGTGRNLPMLVNSGDLRKTVNSKGHAILMRGGNVTIRFTGLMEYATYLHEGTPIMPIRSPVKPNEEDKKQVIEHMRAYLKRATGVRL